MEKLNPFTAVAAIDR